MVALKDKYGVEIKEFAVLKLFHFIGAHKKKFYMYKWVRLERGNLVGVHLTDANPNSWFPLRVIANKETGIIEHAEIVQQYD